MQQKTRKFTQKYKRIFCLALVVLMLVAVVIAIIPSSESEPSVDPYVNRADDVYFMNTVPGIDENLLFSGDKTPVSEIKMDSDKPAFLTNGIKGTNALLDSASRPHLMSNVPISSNKVSVTSSTLDYVISKLDLSGNGIKIINGGNPLSADTSALQALVSKNGMDVGFLAVRLSDGAAISYQAEKMFQSCSVIKAPYALYVAKLVSEGKLSLNKSFAYTSSMRVPGTVDTGNIQYYPFGTHFKVKTLVEYSILDSDNIAHNMLVNYIGGAGYMDMLDRIGTDVTDSRGYVWPESNAISAVKWWSQIYSFKDSGETGKWLWGLFENNYSKIRPALNNAKKCYTKTGSSTYCMHETAIVMGNEPYIIAIYTKTSKPYSSKDQATFNSIVKEIDRIIA